MTTRWTVVLCGLALAWGGGLPSVAAGDAPAVGGSSLPAGNPASGYRFAVGTNQFYVYSLKQTVAWASAGDQLSFTSTLGWKFLLTVAEVTPERALLDVTILRVQASHMGPGTQRVVDSSLKIGEDGGDDPLLGHLLACHMAVLHLSVHPTTGQVSEVRGGDDIVTRINQRAKPTTPGDPPPLDAAARAAFSSEALMRLWNQMLAQPVAGITRVPLGPPLGGEIERVWEGSTYRLRLPAGSDRLNATLVGDPTPVSAVLSELTGSGNAAVGSNGLPGAAKGDLAFQVAFQALTQPVIQRHSMVWELTPLDPR
jgi:hypothetical protein